MGILSWIVFGALAGWVAGMIVGTSGRQGLLTNIIVGIVGAFIGGFLMSLVTKTNFGFNWSWESFAVAVVGSVLLLVITGAGKRF